MAAAAARGYECQTLDSRNSAQIQLNNAQDAIARGMAGLVISPTDSSTAPSVLYKASAAKIPVVIADIGANEGEYLSFVSADNYVGAYDVGKALATGLRERGWQDSAFGISAISQARKNGQARTSSWTACAAAQGRQASLQQMQAYTAEETFRYTQDMLAANPDLRALFVQTDQPTIGALRA